MAVYNGGKDKNIIASGQIGENPTIHIWNAQTRKTLSVLSGKHKRGNSCASKSCFDMSAFVIVLLPVEQNIVAF